MTLKEDTNLTISSTSAIDTIREDDKKLSISLMEHSGVFYINNSDENSLMIEKLRKAELDKQSINFSYDKHLNILDIE